ncbi:MAG: hypothetical protein F4190_13780 [Acidimicrobiales bacterium]|nr:hypothetical protein [Acidimicrobiales bacterium]MYG89574.1 hypothetical protein [Acidimicrobiales bacterium]MYI27230.1 hypothetical protein [Acidimicrobiales bacterium]
MGNDTDPLRRGDKVQHVTGGPVMAIDSFDVSGQKAIVTWYFRERGQKQGEFHRETFDVSVLVRVADEDHTDETDSKASPPEPQPPVGFEVPQRNP